MGVKMDVDGDGFVSHQELKKWIYKNFRYFTEACAVGRRLSACNNVFFLRRNFLNCRSINEEQSVDRFEDADTDKDGLVTWSENLAEAWGFSGDEAEQLMTSPDYAEDRLVRFVYRFTGRMCNFVSVTATPSPEMAPRCS